MNVVKEIIDSSIIIEWDEDDFLPTIYTVTWASDENNSTQSRTLIEQSSYSITGLTLDAVYIITVTAANRCGQGPEYRSNVSLFTGTHIATVSLKDIISIAFY